MDFLPVWTEKGNWSLGRDPLGIQATSVRMYRTLVPGLTNVTNRLRYFSFYCWVVARYQDTVHADDLKQWRRFIRRAEALYALACEAYSPATPNGLAGSDWAGQRWPTIKDGEFDFSGWTDRPGEANQYLKARGANFGQFYVASMQEVGLLQQLDGIPLVTPERGRPMAEAFAEAVGSTITAYLDKSISNARVTRAALTEIGRAVYPASIDASSREMRHLRNFLLADTPDITLDTTRRTSAWLLVDLASRGVNIHDDGALRTVFYQRHLQDGTPYKPAGAAAVKWQAYQANELTHIALEVLLNGVANLINAKGGEWSPAALCHELVEKAVSAEMRDAPWTMYAAKVSQEPISESQRAGPLLQGLRRFQLQAGDQDLHQHAAKLLGTLWQRWAGGQGGVLDEVSKAAGPRGHSMAGVFATLDQHAQNSTSDALQAVMRRHLIADHLVIAGRKLAGSGRYTYRFTQADGALSDGIHAEYGYTNPRLSNLAQFLVDAKLVNDQLQLTSSGTRFLHDHQPA